MFLMCQLCGNAYGSPPRNAGDTCGVSGCSGTLIPHPYVKPAAPKREGLLLKCNKCGNAYSSPPKNIWDTCGANGCTGVLDKY